MKVTHKTVSPEQINQPVPAAAMETPSQKISREGRQSHEIMDELGRKIVYRNLSVLEEARLARFLGSEHSANQEYMKYVRVACAVQSINGDPGVIPNKMSFIEQRIGWVDDEGFLAVWKDMVDRMKVEVSDDDDVSDEDNQNQDPNPEGTALKNS